MFHSYSLGSPICGYVYACGHSQLTCVFVRFALIEMRGSERGHALFMRQIWRRNPGGAMRYCSGCRHKQHSDEGSMFQSGGWRMGRAHDRKRDREGLSGENKPFAALIESLAAVPSCQGRRLFTTWPLKESLF